MSANSFSVFKDLATSGNKEPSRSNLFSVEVQIPTVMFENASGIRSSRGLSDYYQSINYFADTVTVPGRRITTGTVRDVGAMRRFATDTTFSEMTCSFIVTKDMYHREWFERWMNYTASDSENRASFYDDYTADIYINKWEVGSNVVYEGETKGGHKFAQRLNRSTATWVMYNAFPYDMSEMTFNNGPTDLLRLDVSFYYERYRFDTISMDKNRFGGKDRKIKNFDDIALRLGISTEQSDVARFGV